MWRHFNFVLILACCAARPLAAQLRHFDVVVYGGTSAAVAASVEVARLGKSVVLVAPDRRVGGMTANGLGWTDLGARDTIGGISREFYRRVYDHYLDDSAWTAETRDDYVRRSRLDPDAARHLMFTFEPKVAAAIFDQLIAEAGVTLVAGRLDRASGVTRQGTRITSIATKDGPASEDNTFEGKMFIDATYEGDLMAAAGASYAVGREANREYGERLNGIQVARATKNQLPRGIDPFVAPGDASSGLLPGVNATAGGPDGSADRRLQAFAYRMVLTDDRSNRVPAPQPAGYDESRYELLFRAIAAGQTTGFFKLDPMPNRKTDSNNEGGISTDFIGGNYDAVSGVNYAEADDATRQKMLAAHRDYQQGLLWALQHSPRVPESIRNAMSQWGLPLDEFADNNHWPEQIYVREGRRLVGQTMITERHVNQEPGFESADSIGMGGYNMDSHNVQRHVGADGSVRNEGDVQVAPAKGPYPISYGAIVTRKGEADNLLVPVAVSATHIAYGSLRMEPVFMVLGHSAGAAAAIACDKGVPARDVPYALLRAQLLQDEQILEK